MNVIAHEFNFWSNSLWKELVNEISPERRDWILGKMYYSAMKSAGRRFISYTEKPQHRGEELLIALEARSFAQDFRHDNLDLDGAHAHIAQSLIPVGEEAAKVEKPEWISDEEWEQAQHDALHDDRGDLIRPKLEGFLEGARYDKPSISESEFDPERVKQITRGVVHAALYKAEADCRLCTQRLTTSNSEYWRNRWLSRSWDAKQDFETVKVFIAHHNLEYEE